LPTETIIECITGFVERKKSWRQPNSFKQWVLQNFGVGFAKHFFFSYQEKIFDYPVNKLSASWTGRFVPATSLTEMLRGALESKTVNVGYNSHFFYPHKGGIYFWLDKLAQQLINLIHTEHTVSKIDIKNKVIYFANGHSEPYKQLITTLPLDIMLDLVHEPSNSMLKKARKNLLCNSVTNFNLGVNKLGISDKHWIYYPEKQYPFYRVGFWHNFSKHMAPAGHSSLYGEFSTLNKSPEHAHDLLKNSLAHIKKLFTLSAKDIVIEKIIQVPHAYVIYNRWRDTHLATLLQTLEQTDIYSIGRYGAWKYSSMQEGLLDGKAVAEKVLAPVTQAEHDRWVLNKIQDDTVSPNIRL
jgi:protoporphyrinogen oxidase